MSITKTRKFIERSGCGLIVSVVVGVIMLLGIVLYGQTGGSAGNGGGSPVAFQAGDLAVPTQAVEMLAQAAAASQGARLEALPPMFRAQVYAGVLQELTLKAKMLQLAEQAGVKMDDAAIRNGIDREIDAIVANLHGALLSSKQIPEKTTVEQVAQLPVVQRQVGEMRAILERMLQEEDLRRVLAARYADQGLRDAERARFANATDAEVKTMFDSYVLGTIRVALSSDKPEEARELGRKIAEEVRSEGFDAVAKKYKDRKNPSVDVLEGQRMPRAFLAMLPEYRPVLSLKKGQSSGFVESPTGGLIFHVRDIVNETPKDFEQKKDQYKSRYVDEQANLALQTKIAELEKASPIVWKDPGFKALYDWSQAPRTREALLKVAEEARAAAESESTVGLPQAILARYASVEDAWSLAPEKERGALREARAEAIAALLTIAEDPALRLELAQLFLDLKQGERAYEQLLSAAEVNTGFDPINESHHKQIRQKLERLWKAKLIDEAQRKAVERELERWVQEKAENDKMLAEQRRFEEEQARKDAEEAKRLEAEEKAKLEAERQKARQSAPAESGKK
ncbi:MAG: hypothetical protein N2109_10800 [Fimbriimonadales bacterium]|nr:hypothetical protein [Fimbriimonadales bacterium]